MSFSYMKSTKGKILKLLTILGKVKLSHALKNEVLNLFK